MEEIVPVNDNVVEREQQRDGVLARDLHGLQHQLCRFLTAPGEAVTDAAALGTCSRTRGCGGSRRL